MGKISAFLDKTFSSYITMSIIGLIAFILALLMPFFIPSVELIKTLQGLVQLNITVAIGMGALSIALKTEKVLLLIKEILVLMFISTLGYFVSLTPFLNTNFIIRMFVMLNGIVLIQLLLSTVVFIKKNVEPSTKKKK